MFESRLRQLQGLLPHHEIDALLVTSPYNIAYLTGIHAFSIEEREARLLITKQDSNLFTDARYTEMVKEKAPYITLIEISSTAPFPKSLKQIIESEKIKELGFEEENITYKEAADLEQNLKIELIPTVDIVEGVRIVKDNNEIKSIKKACALTDKGFEFVLKLLKPGVNETDIKAQLENFIRLQGGDISFSSIVAYGANSAIPHHLSSDARLQTSDIILLDFGAKVGGYCSDMTRTVFIGKPNEKFEKMYQATLEAQELALDYLKTHTKEGFDVKKVQELANSHLRKVGFTNIPHAIGHGVGLQVHESPTLSPVSDSVIKPGMIVTVEPGVYVPQLGGIRIEDTVLIIPDGIEILTKSAKEMLVLNP